MSPKAKKASKPLASSKGIKKGATKHKDPKAKTKALVSDSRISLRCGTTKLKIDIEKDVALDEHRRSRPDRRDAEKKAIRAIKRRLWPLYGEVACDGARNSCGKSLKQVVRVAYEVKTGYIRKGYWSELAEEFGLQIKRIELAEPDNKTAIPKALDKALKIFLSDNPAEKKTRPIEEFFKFNVVSLDYSVYHGVIMLTLENERTTHAFMSKVHMSILMHAEKTHGAAKGDVIWVGVGVGLWGLVRL